MTRSKKGQILGATAVMIVPALLALFLTQSQASDQTPRVTDMIRDMSSGPSDRPRSAPDSPVGGATQGGKSLSIDFERGSRVALGKMDIPAIGLHTNFYDGVVDEAVELGPGHWPGTPWPGEPGNTVFAGHRTTYTHPFGDLDLLEKGARVRVEMRNSKPTTYRVFRTLVVSEQRYASVVLKQPSDKTVRMITLFACTPKGSRSHRIIVQAKAVPVDRGATRSSEEAKR